MSRRSHPFLPVPFLFYGLTVSHTVGLPDSAVLLQHMREPVLRPHAWNHPLLNLLGWLALRVVPGDNEFLKVNLVSSLCAGTAIALFYLALVRLGVARRPAALGASAFMVSHSMWWHGVWVESYALNVVFLFACLHAVITLAAPEPKRTWVVSAGGLLFAAGLGLFQHLQNGALFLAALGVVAWRVALRPDGQSRWHALPRLLGAAGLGLLPWLGVVTAEMLCGLGAQGTVEVVLGGPFRDTFWRYDGLAGGVALLHLLFLQFPTAWVLAGLVLPFLRAAAPATRPPAREPLLFLVAVLLVNLVVFLGYRTWDQYAFLLVAFAILAFFAALALGRLWGRSRPASRVAAAVLLAAVCAPPLLVPRIPGWVRSGHGYWFTRYGHIEAQYRDRYDLVGLLVDPWGKDQGSLHAYVRQAAAFMHRPAALYDDEATLHQLLAVAGHPPDLVRAGQHFNPLDPPGQPHRYQLFPPRPDATGALRTTSGPYRLVEHRLPPGKRLWEWAK